MPRKKQERKPKPETLREVTVEMPYDVNVEREVLGAIITRNEFFYEAAAVGLKTEDFHLDAHRRIYMAMGGLAEAQVPMDVITLMNFLEGQGELEPIGGIAYLSSLLQGIVDRPSVKNYVDILKDKSLRRSMVYMGNRITMMAQDPSDPIKFTMEGAHQDLLRLQGDAQEKSIVPVKEITGGVLKTIEEFMSFDPNKTIGISFGNAKLDELTTGIRPAQFVVIGGFPKSGKTSFAIDIARKTAKAGIPVGFFSREMLKEELIERVLAQESDVPYAQIRRPTNLSISNFRLLERTQTQMENWPLYIDDTATDIGELIPRAHLMIRQKAVKLLVIDYLQIIDGPGEKEFERVTYVANALTSLAKITKIPILVLSQLTHPEGKKGDLNYKPNMGMLRSSGQIAQNAHIILFTYHPIDDEGQPTGMDQIICGAQRAGVTGMVKSYFNVAQQRWEDRIYEEKKPEQQGIDFKSNGKTNGKANGKEQPEADIPY